jgi:hypothetical protein
MQLVASVPDADENDPVLRSALGRGIADDEADRVHSAAEVKNMIPQWISQSRSRKAP